MKVPKKRGRPRKYGPDGSLIRPLNATPISASAPMAAAVAAGQYTPASAVGAAMKRGRGRPLDFAAAAGKQHQHHQLHHHHHQQHHQPFGFHFDSIGTSLRSFSPMFFSTIFFGVNPQTVPEKKVGFSLSLFSRGIREWLGGGESPTARVVIGWRRHRSLLVMTLSVSVPLLSEYFLSPPTLRISCCMIR
jgi:hypothetical protein